MSETFFDQTWTFQAALGFAVLQFVLGSAAGLCLAWRFGGFGSGRRRNSESNVAAAAKTLAGSAQQLHTVAERIKGDLEAYRGEVEEISDSFETTSKNATPTSGAVSKTLSRIVESNRRLQQRLMQAEKQLQEQSAELAKRRAEARTDPLTGLLNRRSLNNELDKCVSNSRETKQPCSLILFDLDGFKQINDTYRHRAGDAVLQWATRTLSRHLARPAMLARYGGDEFAVLMPESSITLAADLAQSMRQTLDDSTLPWEGHVLRVTGSFGVAELRSEEAGCSLVDRSDKALYAAKEAGRNAVMVHDGRHIHPHQVKASEPPADEASVQLADEVDEQTLSHIQDLCAAARRSLEDRVALATGATSDAADVD